MAFTPTFLQGDRYTVQANLLNGLDSRRLFNKDGKIYELDSRSTPLLTLLFSDTSKFGLTDPDFQFLEHRPYWTDLYKFYAGGAGGTAITDANAGTTTTLVVEKTAGGSDDVGFLRTGMTVRIIDAGDKTKEAILRVTTVTNQQSITLTLISPKPGFDIADGDEIRVIGNAFAEGSVKTSSTNDTLTTRWGSAQIFKQLISASNDVLKTKLQGGDEWARLERNALKALWTDIERTLFFGFRYVTGTAANPNPYEQISSTSATSAPTRLTAGIRQCITYANTYGFGNTTIFSKSMATYTYGNLVDDMEQAFYLGSDTKVAFCGRGVISFFQKMALSESMLNLRQKESAFGFSVFEIVTAHGVLKLIPHPLLNGQDAYTMVVLDMDNLGLGIHRNLEKKEHVEDNGKDTREDQWLISLGLMYALPETGSWWTFTA